MKILALDASLAPFSVALDRDGTVTAEQSAQHDALEAGLARVARLLAGAGLSLGAIDRIAVGIGPGSFTGIRIALSYAKALAFAANRPLVGVSSYDVLTPRPAPEPCLTMIAGRPGVVCARLTAGASSAVACGTPAGVVARLTHDLPPDPPLTIVGRPDVLAALDACAPANSRLCAARVPNPAVAVAALARLRAPASSPHSVAPDYGELPAVSRPKGGTEIGP